MINRQIAKITEPSIQNELKIMSRINCLTKYRQYNTHDSVNICYFIHAGIVLRVYYVFNSLRLCMFLSIPNILSP